MTVSEENKISDETEIMYRQVHPKLLDKERPVSRVFEPNSNDNDLLSLDRSSLTTPKEAFERYTMVRQSSAVFGVSIAEFDAENINCYSDPIFNAGEENPSHALADYRGLSSKDKKSIAMRLRDVSIKRGKLHPAS